MQQPNLLDLATRHALALVQQGVKVWWALEQTQTVFGLTDDQTLAVRRSVVSSGNDMAPG